MFILAKTVYITITKYIKQTIQIENIDKFIFMLKVSAFMHVPAFNFTELKSVAKTKQNHNTKKRYCMGAVARCDYCCLSAAT